MFESVQNREDSNSIVNVDIAPLIDMVFILLIFFLVTARFVYETGITVKRPQALGSEKLAPESMRIAIAASGSIYIKGQQVDLGECRERVRRFMEHKQDGLVIVISDEAVPVKRLIAVMDMAKQGNAGEIAVATRKKDR